MDNGISATVFLEEIRKEIEILLYDRFELKEDIIERLKVNFFWEHGMFNPRELTYLAYMLEMRYGIQFGIQEYDDQRFYNLTGLLEIVGEMVAKKTYMERGIKQ